MFNWIFIQYEYAVDVVSDGTGYNTWNSKKEHLTFW